MYSTQWYQQICINCKNILIYSALKITLICVRSFSRLSSFQYHFERKRFHYFWEIQAWRLRRPPTLWKLHWNFSLQTLRPCFVILSANLDTKYLHALRFKMTLLWETSKHVCLDLCHNNPVENREPYTHLWFSWQWPTDSWLDTVVLTRHPSLLLQ